MSKYFSNTGSPPPYDVNNGDTSAQTDINSLVDAIDNGFTLVAADYADFAALAKTVSTDFPSSPIKAVLTGSDYDLTLWNNAGTPAEVTTIDVDGTLAGNSDIIVPTQKAVKTYADLMLPLGGGTMTGDITLSSCDVVAGGNRWERTSGGYPYYATGGFSHNWYLSATDYMGYESIADGLKLTFNSLAGTKGISLYEGASEASRWYSISTTATELRSTGHNTFSAGTGSDVTLTCDAGGTPISVRLLDDAGGSDSAFIPVSSGVTDLGYTGYLWEEVWASVGSINTSDAKLKNSKPIEDANWLYNVTPVEYTRKDRPHDKRTFMGFEAQDIETHMEPVHPGKDMSLVRKPKDIWDIDKKKWKKDKDGKSVKSHYGLCQTELMAPMLKLIQDQKQTIDAQQAQINDLIARVEALEGV